jgi:Acetyl xylan esterase (AXE1)
MIHRCACALLLCLLARMPVVVSAQEVPAADGRAAEIRHLDLTYRFDGYKTKDEWLARAAHLRRQILASAGLLPLPLKTPLEAVRFDKTDRGDHTVEKVYFESVPGFYVTGNLYRPKTATGKLPAVLCPHGHWSYGRLENQTQNSGPGRPAGYARQGYVAFAYDMVGYVDSTAVSHRFAAAHRENAVDRNALWSVNLLGLQLWNSIRALDFLLTLPDVDAERIGVTGESGGGTQTFLLTAVDDRVRASAPVNMVSFLMQGGSLCENAPNLRIDTNNVEIAALAAPRPLMLIAATGDWTRNVPESEYPAIRKIYQLFDAEEKVTAVRMDAPHNYNQASREAVYGWFAHWLLGRAETGPIRERGGGVATLPELLVFYGRARPANELNEEQLAGALIERARKQLADAEPRDAAGLEQYNAQFGAALKASLLAEFPAGAVTASNPEVTHVNQTVREEFALSRRGTNDRVPVTLRRPDSARPPAALTVLVTPSGHAEDDLPDHLLRAGHAVLALHGFAGGQTIPAEIKFFTTYNRTDDACRVQDILTALAYGKGRFPQARINLAGRGEAGLWVLLARGLAPQVDRTILDAAGFDSESDAEFVRRLPIPGLRRAGDFATAVALAPLTPLTIYNRGDRFQTNQLESLYRRFGRAEDLKSVSGNMSNAGLAAWLSAKK